MKRTLPALLLAAGLLLSGCGGSQSGDSNGESPADEAPGTSGEVTETAPTQ